MSHEGSATPHTSHTLLNRTYIGLLAAQFLAAFNDQAIHAAGMFFAINTNTLSEAQAISLMPILFYAPWALFCTVAGYLSDRFSKRSTLVLWKVAEVAITAIALVGFWLGTEGKDPNTGAWIVLSTVFLMGTHSAFFVPAKYGIMPEILHPSLLSRGNGLLESLSFLAVILGTVSGGVLSFVFLNREMNIGIVLLVLAIVGALASFLIRGLPASNPNLAFPKYVYGPLVKNVRLLLTTRTLSFAVIGIAFFTFIVAFMRATVYMFGESQNPRWDELKTSITVGTVALGVGVGSPLAGWLSGRKIELGLIPLGAIGMMTGCVVASFTLDYIPGFVASTILIGACTGFYLVPLFTLLQHRAPKGSKGDMIATSNLVNVTGAIASSLLFAGLVWGVKKAEVIPKVAVQDELARGELTEVAMLRGRPVFVTVAGTSYGRRPTDEEQRLDVAEHLFGEKAAETRPEIHMARQVALHDAVTVSGYTLSGVEYLSIRPAAAPLPATYDARQLPRYLFLGAGILTGGVLFLLWRRVRDLPQRALGVLRGRRWQFEGLANVPGHGPTVFRIATTDADAIRAMTSAVDRYVVLLEPTEANVATAKSVLDRGDLVGIAATHPHADTFCTLLACPAMTVTVEGNRLVFA